MNPLIAKLRKLGLDTHRAFVLALVVMKFVPSATEDTLKAMVAGAQNWPQDELERMTDRFLDC